MVAEIILVVTWKLWATNFSHPFHEIMAESPCKQNIFALILSFILKHRPIFDVSDFPMLLGFRFSTDRTIDSIRVSFYHFLWDF